MYAVCSIKCVSEIYTYLYIRNDLGVEMIMESPLSPDHMMPLQLCWLSIMHECIEQYKSVAGNAQKKERKIYVDNLESI